MPVFPCRDIDAVSWVAGAAVTHLDQRSRFVSATCWSSSHQLNEAAFDLFVDTVGPSVAEPDRLGALATQDPLRAFEYCHELLGHQASPEIAQLATAIEAKTRLVFHRSIIVDVANTEPTTSLDSPVDIVIPYRSTPDNPLRARNLAAVLSALEDQTVQRAEYRVTVVEESEAPTVPSDPAFAVDNYIHIAYGGPFNKALALNRGVDQAGLDGILCLLDADIFPDRDFVHRNVLRITESPNRLHLPYSDAFCVLDGDSAALVADGYRVGRTYGGYLVTHPAGGCVWITQESFGKTGGFDENFTGWGGEDRDFADRAGRIAPVLRHPELLTHLYHERPVMPSSRKEIMAAVGKSFEGEDE